MFNVAAGFAPRANGSTLTQVRLCACRGLVGLLRSWLGNTQHLWMWDHPSLRKELETAGFSGIRAAQLGDSEDPLFAAVEDKSRWEDAIALQCYA